MRERILPLVSRGVIRQRMTTFKRWIIGLSDHLKARGKRVTQAELAEALGVEQPTISRWRSGSEPEYENIEAANRYARTVGYQPFASPSENEVKVLGYIGAGAEVVLFHDSEVQSNFDPITDAPSGLDNAIGLIVRGSSMWPKYEDGDVVIVEEGQYDLSSLLNELCYIKLADGHAYLKILARGSSAGLYTLKSHNAPDIEDVIIEHAYPIAWVKPRRGFRKAG